MWDSFEVSSFKGGRIVVIILSFILFLTTLAGEIFVCSLRAPVGAHLACLMLMVGSLFLMLYAMFSGIKVEGNEITETTIFGKKHKINVSEITKISCYSSYNFKSGQTNTITIETERETICVRGGIDGFGTMTTYLLKKLESGEISKRAVAFFTKRKLQKWYIIYNSDSRKSTIR